MEGAESGSIRAQVLERQGARTLMPTGTHTHTHTHTHTRVHVHTRTHSLTRIIHRDGHHRICVGVTTGDLLCTCVGARKMRSEYTVFGDAINLSARLMMKCRGGVFAGREGRRGRESWMVLETRDKCCSCGVLDGGVARERWKGGGR